MFALQPELKVFTGSANRDLAERICKYIGVPLGQATISSFPDGETYVKIEENIRGHDVFIVQPTSPADQSAFDGVADHGGRGATRQRGPNHGCHSIFWIRAPGPQRSTARADHGEAGRESCCMPPGVNRVLTMDLHAQQVQGFFDIPVDHLYSAAGV